jgi:hypothetical protein
MIWPIKRLIIPLVLNTMICVVMLQVWIALETEGWPPSIRASDFAVFMFLLLPFEALGLVLLLPIALFVCDLSLPRLLYPTLLMVAGGALGVVVVLPTSERPFGPDLVLPATCGATSALIWIALNRDAIKART